MRQFMQSIRRWFRPIRTLLVEYCDHSNIHGVRYLTEKLLHWSERLWWIIALGASLGLCGYAAINIWVDWRDNPVTLSYTEASIPISEIPFPTITICPKTKADKRYFNPTVVLERVTNLTKMQRITLNSMAHICPRLAKKIEFNDDFAHEDIYYIMGVIALKSKNTFLNLLHIFKDVFIVQVFTDEGVCFTINALNSHDIYTDDMAGEMKIVSDNKNASNWSLDKDILNKSTVEERYPIHEIRSEPLPAFSATLRIFEKDLDYECRGSDQGFEVMLSTPGDVLQFSKNSYRTLLEEIVLIFIKPKLTTTSNGLSKYNPQQRQCFFDSERQLRFFKIYSQNNCETECLANYTKSECGCVKFSQPRDRNTKVCGGARINCYETAERSILNVDNSTKLYRDKCNCLPACTSIKYEVDIERRMVDMKNMQKKYHSTYYHQHPFQYTSLRIFFRDDLVKVLKRIESNTVPDFLAFCGGLLGVFMGVSALSVVEIIYFATLRLYFIIRPMQVSNAVVPFHQENANNFDRFRFIRGIHAFLVEFCDNSNIHGFIYFTRRGLHWIERLWWIVSFGLSLWLCSTMIIDVWRGWQENPVKMAFTRNERPISDIPFPTITICPDIKFMRHKLDLRHLDYIDRNNLPNFSNYISSMRDNKNFRSVLHFCPNLIKRMASKEILIEFPLVADEDICDVIREIAPQFDDVLHKCIWQSKVVNCSMYMAPILTQAGLCFTFNALNSHEMYTDDITPEMKAVKSNSKTTTWNMENGYENGTNQNDYPLRAYDSGRGSAFEISLDSFEKYFDFICYYFEQGFIVTLGAPGDDLKQYLSNSFHASLFEDTMIMLKPKLTTTSNGLRKYNPNHRKCFFESERKLRFYKSYTQSNCEQECLSNFTKEQCGCVKFSHPRDGETPVCGFGKIECYANAEVHLLEHLAFDKDVERKHLEICNCLPSCTTIEYNTVVDRVHFNKSAIVATAGRNVNMSGIHQAKLVFFFEDRLFETEQRKELYTITDLFATCGGLLGLFMGISVLSIAEIIYYSSLRWYWILRRATFETN